MTSPCRLEGSPAATAIVRTRNSAGTVTRTFESLRAQDVPVEIVVVDSGSTDGTLEVASRWADRVIEIASSEFTFGGALNRGAEAASASVHLALSSHCSLSSPRHVRTAVDHIGGGALGVFGSGHDQRGTSLEAPRRLDHAALTENRFWGYSNHAGAWAASAWRREPFRVDLPASEDREWSWRVSRAGGYLVVDPTLLVEGQHRRDAGVASYYRRLVKEGTALLPWRPLPPYSLGAALRDLTAESPGTAMISASRRLGRTRAVEVVARASADRVQRRRGRDVGGSRAGS